MGTVYILNIPNFYSSYYLLGFSNSFNVKFKMEKAFLKYNKKPL